MTQRIWICGFALALAPAIAAAQADRFRALDRNQDGSVSSEEWYAHDAPVPFTLVDLDSDGRISQAEFRDWSAARGGAREAGITTADRFGLADRNKDKMISENEWKDRFPFVGFDAVDADRDRRISYQEFHAWDAKRGGALATVGSAPDLMADRLRALDARGAAGAGGPAGALGPAGAVPSNSAPASVGPATATVPRVTPETSPVTGTISTSPGAAPGAATPALGTGSGLTTR